MKTLILLLLIMFLAIAYAKVKHKGSSRCALRGGICVRKAGVQGRCVKLGARCGPATICCKNKRSNVRKRGRKTKISKGVERKCRKTSKKCAKKGGTCVSKNESKCATTVDKLCKGKSCTCCLGGNCQCGQANEARIVGGKEVSPKNKYPWMVGIAYVNNNLMVLFCGGTLINDRYVITAAHCLLDDEGNDSYEVNSIKIVLADHNIQSTDDNVQGVTQFVDIEKYKVNKKYNAAAFDEDIALIKLKEPLDLFSNKEIKPVCLPTDKDETYEGADGIVTGWGLTDPGDETSGSAVLLEVALPILSPECKGNFKFSIPITENMLCAGSFKKGGKAFCKGDSGGPLVVKEGTIHTLVGIVSFGVKGCAFPEYPGVNTRVTQYLDWIIENTSDANYCS